MKRTFKDADSQRKYDAARKQLATGIEPVSHPIIRRIVGSHHAATCNLSIVRAVLHCLRNWRAMDKRSRRYAIASALQHHAENRHEYACVMRGDFRTPGLTPRYWFRASDKAVLIK